MKTWQVIAGAAALVVALPVGCTYLGVATNVATAPARVANKTLQTDNIIFNYEGFFNRDAAYKSRLAGIQTHKSILAEATDPAERSRLTMELAAQRQSCRDLANQYNADAQKLNRGLFRSNNLPVALSETECNA